MKPGGGKFVEGRADSARPEVESIIPSSRDAQGSPVFVMEWVGG